MNGLSTLMGPRWPYTLPGEDTFKNEALPSILNWWQSRRLVVVPEYEHFWSPASRQLLDERAEEVRSGHRDGGGYEWLDSLRHGSAEAAWSLDLGCLAWSIGLSTLRRDHLLPGTPDEGYLDLIEKLWRENPEKAEVMLQGFLANDSGVAPWAAWYWLPLRLWGGEEDEDVEADLVDTFLATLSPRAIDYLGPTAPLTLAWGAARAGDYSRAVAILTPGGRGAFPFRALTGDEVRYHRARYLWMAGELEKGASDAVDLWRSAPSMWLRALQDPVWSRALRDPQSVVVTQVERAVHSLRSEGARWRAPTEEMRRYPGYVNIMEQSDRVPESHYEAFLFANTAQQYNQWRLGEAALTPRMQADLERIRTFSETAPSDFPLRLLVTDARLFNSSSPSVPSDLGILKRTVREGAVAEASGLAQQISSILPSACRVALSGYALRLLDAMEAAGAAIVAAPDESSAFRLSTLNTLVKECQSLGYKIGVLETETGAGLGRGVADLWEWLMKVENAWVKTDRRAFGTLEVRHVEGPGLATRGAPSVVRLGVFDGEGKPVGGVPVEWSVIRGPAHPLDATDGLAIEWATSLAIGTVILRVRIEGPGEEVVIRARVLGSASSIDIPFRVQDKNAASFANG